MSLLSTPRDFAKAADVDYVHFMSTSLGGQGTVISFDEYAHVHKNVWHQTSDQRTRLGAGAHPEERVLAVASE